MAANTYWTALSAVSEDLGSILSEMYGSETDSHTSTDAELQYTLTVGSGKPKLPVSLTTSVLSVQSVHQYLGHTDADEEQGGMDHTNSKEAIWEEADAVTTQQCTAEDDDKLPEYLRLKISSVLWFYPTVSRKQAETMLDGKDPGTFLVRNSRQVGNFALSVCLPVGMQPTIQHYLITKNAEGLSFDQAERYFTDLESLVAHYVCSMSDGMPCVLMLPSLISSPLTKAELMLAVNREAERRAMIALSSRYSTTRLTCRDEDESPPSKVKLANGRVHLEMSTTGSTTPPPPLAANDLVRRSKTMSSITERTVQALLRGRTSKYFDTDENNYATTDSYDIDKIRPLVPRDRRAITVSASTLSCTRRESMDTATSLSSVGSGSREEIDNKGDSGRTSRFRAVIARLKKPFSRRHSRRHFQVFNSKRNRSLSHEILRTSTPVKAKKSNSVPMGRHQVCMDTNVNVNGPSPANRPRLPSPDEVDHTLPNTTASTSSLGGEGIYSSLGSSSSESLVDSDWEQKAEQNASPPIPPYPQLTGDDHEVQETAEDAPRRPTSCTYASIEDIGLSPKTLRAPPRPPPPESIPEITENEMPPTPPPRPPKRSSSPPPLPERRRLVTIHSISKPSDSPPPLPKRNVHTRESADESALPSLSYRPRAVTMPASLLCRPFDHHATTSTATESDYLVPIEELQKMSGNHMQQHQSESQVTEANKPIPPVRTRESFEAVTQHQEQPIQLEQPLSSSSIPAVNGGEKAPVYEETTPQALRVSVPVVNVMPTHSEDHDSPQRSPGFSYTTDDIPPTGEWPFVDMVCRRSRSESLLDSLMGDVSMDIQHLLSGPSTDTVDDLQSEDEDSHLVVSFKESAPARSESLQRRFTDACIIDEVKHSDMPDETRLRSRTISRMRASVRQTRDRLASHSHGVRHSVVEKQRLATLVHLAVNETEDTKDVSAAERARLSILHSGPKLLALRKNRTPSRRIGGQISKMATNRNMKLGFNIDKFVAKVKDGSHTDPVQLVTEVRNFMNQLKTYLLTDTKSELYGVLAKECHTEDIHLDAVVEGVLVKAVIRPLQRTVRRCFSSHYELNGSLQLLSDNLQLAAQKNPVQLGVKDNLIPPQGPSLDHIKGKLNKMQATHSPLCKLEHLLAAVDIIYQSVKDLKTEVGGEDLVLGADDFLPIFIYVLSQVHFRHAEIEAEYMWGLLDPSLLTGEGGYYLTTLSSAVMVLKQIHEPTHAGSKKMRRMTRLPHIGDLQGYMRVRLPDQMNVDATVFKTLPIGPSMTVRDACQLIAQKLSINNLENFTLYKVVDNRESILDDDFQPQHLKMEWVLLDLEAEREGQTPVERYFAFKRKPFTDL